MSTIGQWILGLADTVAVWRDLAITVLALFVIGCLYLYASLVSES